MILLLFMEFIAFPERKDALLKPHASSVNVESSGSLGLFYNGKCHKTFPNETFHENEEFDWCSNIADKKKDEKPWISYNLMNQRMKITGYSVRNGCCRHLCCCEDDGDVYDYGCCCVLYSFSLQGSNDNKTWKTLHSVEKPKDFWGCMHLTFQLDKPSEYFTFIRLVQNEEYPGCPYCMQVNQVELYGESTASGYTFIDAGDDNDETVSIIGKVKRDN